MEKYPKLCIEDYVDSLTKDENVCVPPSKENINICISGGGMANMYFAGCASFLTYMVVNKNVKIHDIYGTSAGAISGLLLLLTLYSVKNERYCGTEYEMNCSKFIYLVNNQLREKYTNDPYVIDVWVEVLKDMLPPDFYTVCCRRLYITIHVIDGFSIRKKVISEYINNEHLLNTLRCSGTIPFITTKKFASKYFDYLTQTEYWAFDGGIFPSVEDLSYPTIYFNTLYVNYSLLSRMRIEDKCYEPLVLEGLYDIYHTYRKDVKTPKNANTQNIIYYYDPDSSVKRHKKYIVIRNMLLCGITAATLYYNRKLSFDFLCAIFGTYWCGTQMRVLTLTDL